MKLDDLDHEVKEILDKIADRIIGKGRREDEIEHVIIRTNCCEMAKYVKEPVVEISSLDELKNALRKCRVVFVNAYTTYCPYCKLFHPIFENVARKFKGKAGFIRVNLDYAMDVAYAYYIMSTPTTLVIINGKLIDRILGYIDEYEFEAYVEEILRRENCIM